MIWQELRSQGDLDDLISLSFETPSGVAVFKHSTRCSISVVAKNRLESDWNYSAAELPLYLLDLLTYRPVSNAVAEQFGVKHESPQLLIIKNGKCIYQASHLAISAHAPELTS